MTAGTAMSPESDDLFAAGGEMGALMRSIDWAATPVGPVDCWPQSLRTSLSICLASRFPILIWWGPRLVKLYNDAYRPMLGSSKHPRAMGQAGRECWPEIWDLIGPMLEGVLREGKATWSEDQLLLLDRNGYLEECYFTFSYNPIRDESGGIGGVFTAVTETTGEVLGVRRLRALRDVSTRTAEATSREQVCRLAASSLEEHAADVPFALLYLVEGDGRVARLAGMAGVADAGAAMPTVVDLEAGADDAIWPLARVVRGGEALVLEQLPGALAGIPSGPWPEAPRSALVLPVAQAGREWPDAILVAGVSPRRVLDDEYRGFFDLLAGHIGNGVANARAWEETRRRVEALAELDRAKTAFFSNISHEFRTPLTLLLGPLEDAIRRSNGETRASLEIAYHSGLRLLKLVNTLLDFSRIEAGRIEALYRPTDLATLTADLASMFRAAAERAGLRLRVDCPALPESVWIDREMWEKIVLNLISNALKFTLEGEIGVSIGAAQDGRHVELCVRDTGVGIAADELPRVFDRFHRVQAQQTHARTLEGTGIGLALVRELAGLHGGTVDVECSPGSGTAFRVTIPLGSAHLPPERLRPGDAAVDPSSYPAVAAGYIEEAGRWLPADSLDLPAPRSEPRPAEGPLAADLNDARPRILLVDDNADMRDYLAALLRPYWRVEQAGDGAAALRMALTHPPDLVLSDVVMPELDGFGLLRALRGADPTRDVPVILLSARTGDEATVEGFEAGADDYLIKPFSARELLARVQSHLDLARLRREAQHAHDAAHALSEAAERRSAFLAEASAVLAASLDELETLANLARVIVPYLADWCLVHLVHPDGTIERAALQHPDPARVIWAREIEERYGGIGVSQAVLEVLDSGEPIIYPDVTDDMLRAAVDDEEQLALLRSIGLTSGIVLPLVAREQPLGAISLYMADSGRIHDEGDIALAQDLAHRAALAIDNARLYAGARDAARMREDFLSMASHELKTPLTSVKAAVQILARRTRRADIALDRERYLVLIGQLETEVERLEDLVADLLDASRIQRGKLDLRRERFDVAALCELVIARFDVARERTARHSLSLVTAGPVLGDWDAARLDQVLTNLVSNALKYSPQGGAVTVWVSREGDEACVAVSDEGIGITPQEQVSLFQPFERGAYARQQIGGTGLGLYIAQQIVNQHGGQITVESEAGRGSTFTVRLPLTAPAAG